MTCMKPLLILTFTFFSLTKATTIVKPGCQSKCGNLTIPYPFGLTSACSAGSSYLLTCNPPKTFLSTPTGSLEVVNITNTQLYVKNQIAYFCQNSSGHVTSNISAKFSLSQPYFISRKKNLFTLVGCNVLGTMSFPRSSLFAMTGCDDRSSVEPDGCYGYGCAGISIPRGLGTVNITIVPTSSLLNTTAQVDLIGPCGYAFFAGLDQFKFRGLQDVEDPDYLDRAVTDFPVVLDWVFGKRMNCSEAQRDPSNAFACKRNAMCLDGDVEGYNCNCISGYEGNPYLGCTDIDECADPSSNDCSEADRCKNTPGSYNCFCPPGFIGSGRKGVGCMPQASQSLTLKLSLGITIGVVVLLLMLSWIYFSIRKRRLLKMKERFFEQNGGLLLQQLLIRKQGGMETTKIFTIKELKEASNDFNENYILGKGGHGAVYKGILPNNQVVAIKKSKVVDANEIEQFINEMVILMQVNHRHVVKLLGCCLETQVPLLVYEYIPNGTLYDLIHGGLTFLSWNKRLQIAIQVAGALAYLHSSTSIPIIHRDVKSKNILLDENDTVKIADFGASTLIPLDQTQLTTLVQGTLGYLDPEYFYSSQLTAKSDVYSFGVVLAELLTREKPLSSQRSIEVRNLATYFVSSMEKDQLFQNLDPDLVQEASIDDLTFVAKLVKKCLSVRGADRPMIKEVATELERCWKISKHPSFNNGKKNHLNIRPYIQNHHVESSSSNEQYSLYDMMSDMSLPR